MNTAVVADRMNGRMTAVVNGGRADAALIGVAAFLVSVMGAGRPSFWLDENATIAGSTNSLAELWSMLGNVDGVHGLYYLLMHLWFAVFPATEFWARVPSALLIGGAAAGVVVLARALSTRSIAIAAGVVFSILPRTTWAGVEARSYAMSMFDVVWLTVLCVMAVRSHRAVLWVAYGVGLVLAALGNVFVLFAVAVHGVVVLGSERSRRTVAGFAGAVLAATAVIAPFLLLIDGQNKQVAWIGQVGPGTLGQILGDQYFPSVYSANAPIAGVEPMEPFTSEHVTAAIWAWVLVLPLIVVVVLVGVTALRAYRRGHREILDPPRLLIWLSVVWIVVPTGVLVLYSVVGTPMYQPHYLSYTVPGLALLLGVAVVAAGRQPRRIAGLLAVLAVAALPNYVAQRGPYAKFGHDSSQVADLIAAEAAPGECLNIDLTAPGPIIEGLTSGRADAFAALRDPGVERSGADRDLLFESRRPVTAWTDEMADCPALWTVTRRDETLPAHEKGAVLAPGPRLQTLVVYTVPVRLGFQPAERWQFNRSQVVKSVRVRAAG
jgi:mannosyltransferase